MRGSVLNKGDRWYVKIELDPDPVTGRRRQKWHSGFRTRRDAERARVDLLSKFDRGEYVEPSHQTVAEFFAEWLKTIEPTIRESTLESYAERPAARRPPHRISASHERSTPAFSTACTPSCSPPVASRRPV